MLGIMNGGVLLDSSYLYRLHTAFLRGSIVAAVAFNLSVLTAGRRVSAQEPVSLSQGVSLADIGHSFQGVDEDIYLNVIVNGEMRKDMYVFHQQDNGDFIIRGDDLRAIGLVPAKVAELGNGWIDLSALPDVIHSYDPQEDAIEFVTANQNALVPYAVSINSWAKRESSEENEKPRSDLAAVVNYSFYASSGARYVRDVFDFKGVSGNIEGRVSSRFGTFNSGHLLTYSGNMDDIYNSVRLESYWSYSDPEKLLTYQAGDFVSRSLSWSRSVRLGGFQILRNFSLRPDLVTMPLPNLSGSAAVPSAVDLYINNAKRVTENVPVGPFSLTDMPVVSGSNTARLVVRDAQGRETVTEMSFFGSSDMLAKGLLDFSVEAGVPRRYYGSRSNDYDGKFFASGTARYGLTDNLTVEGHAEAGGNFLNGGIGAAFTLWDFGQLSLAGSTSTYKGRSGQQLAVELQLQKWGLSLSARTQRTYSNYNDIASVVEVRTRDLDRIGDWNPDDDPREGFPYLYSDARPPRAVNQVSLGIPLRFDPASLNFVYTEVKNWDIEDSRYLGFSVSRNLGRRAYSYINAFQDLKRSNSYSIFAGLTIMLDDKHSVSYDVNNDHYGTNLTTRLKRQMGGGVGDYGWTLRDIEGNRQQRGASGSYRTPFALVAGSVEQYEHNYRATVDVSGALVFADYSVMPSNMIYDSFAVVNAGAPNVSVYHQNTFYGKTGRNGKIVVPRLTAYRKNRLSIDMETLPLDTLVTETDVLVTPAYQSGIVENFGAAVKSDYVFVSLQDEKGNFIETGSYAEIAGSKKGFDVAYDGMGILPAKGLKYPVILMVERPDNKFCRATLNSPGKRGVTSGARVLVCVPASENAVLQ